MNKLLIRSILYVLKATHDSLNSYIYEYKHSPIAVPDEIAFMDNGLAAIKQACRHLEELL